MDSKGRSILLWKQIHAMAMPMDTLLHSMPDVRCWIAQSHVPKAEPSVEPVLSFTPPGKRSLASPFGAAVTEDEQGMSPPSAAQGDAIRGNDSQANSR